MNSFSKKTAVHSSFVIYCFDYFTRNSVKKHPDSFSKQVTVVDEQVQTNQAQHYCDQGCPAPAPAPALVPHAIQHYSVRSTDSPPPQIGWQP